MIASVVLIAILRTPSCAQERASLVTGSTQWHVQSHPSPNVLGPGPTGAVFIVPLASFGVSLPSGALSGVTSKPAFAYSLGIVAAFYLAKPDAHSQVLAPVVGLSFESRAAIYAGSNDFGSSLRANYLAVIQRFSSTIFLRSALIWDCRSSQQPRHHSTEIGMLLPRSIIQN